MPKGCVICAHEARAEIEKDLGSGITRADVAVKFGLKKHQVDRHASLHDRIQSESSTDALTLDEIGTLEEEVRQVLKKTKVEKIRLDCIARLQSLRSDRLRLQQEEAGAGVVANHPAFQQFAASIQSAVAGCIRCSKALDAALEELDPPGGTRA